MATFTLAWIVVLSLAVGLGASGAMAAVDSVLYVFGDSYADTGNHDPDLEQANIDKPWRVPYGNHWPGGPSGRYSNGHLFTDFFASYMGMRQPVPYRMLNIRSTGAESHREAKAIARSQGVNFAFGGSGVFSTSNVYVINVTTQIEQLRTTIDLGIVNIDDHPESIAVFVLDGNDYMNYIKLYPNLTGIDEFIGEVVHQMEVDLETLCELGLTNFVIGNLGPLGCVPYMTYSVNYTNCVELPNNLSDLHNARLDARVASLQDKLPYVTFQILDLNSAMTRIIEDGGLSLTPCCKKASSAYSCGSIDETTGEPMYTVCPNERTSFYWDEVHPTDHGWTEIFKNMVLPSFEHTHDVKLAHAKM